MTPETIAKLEEAFLLGCGDVEACLFANITKTTLYNYQLNNPEFVDRKEQLKENPIFLARRSVITAMTSDGDLALKFLERRKKDEFCPRTDVNVGGQKDNPLRAILESINGTTADLPRADEMPDE
jgi:hypothetical protein